jgi:hypothetical protein
MVRLMHPVNAQARTEAPNEAMRDAFDSPSKADLREETCAPPMKVISPDGVYKRFTPEVLIELAETVKQNSLICRFAFER